MKHLPGTKDIGEMLCWWGGGLFVSWMRVNLSAISAKEGSCILSLNVLLKPDRMKEQSVLAIVCRLLWKLIQYCRRFFFFFPKFFFLGIETMYFKRKGLLNVGTVGEKYW